MTSKEGYFTEFSIILIFKGLGFYSYSGTSSLSNIQEICIPGPHMQRGNNIILLQEGVAGTISHNGCMEDNEEEGFSGN